MHIGFIGSGNMASIIINIVAQLQIAQPEHIWIYDTEPEKLRQFTQRGMQAAISNTELVRQCDTVFLCVKPQIMPEILDEIQAVCNDTNFISIAAGITTDYIRGKLKKQKSVLRIMPNTPMLLYCGAAAIARSIDATDEQTNLAYKIFSHAGVVITTSEENIDTVTAISGSGPAYFYQFAKIMTDFAVQHGMNGDDALMMAAATMQGAAKMILETGRTPEELTAQVASPGGTTMAALNAFKEKQLEDTFVFALEECRLRAMELKK